MRTLQKLDEDIRINGKVRTYAQLSEAPWQKKLMNFVTTERKVNAKLAKAGIDYEFRGFENQLAPLGLEVCIKGLTNKGFFVDCSRVLCKGCHDHTL